MEIIGTSKMRIDHSLIEVKNSDAELASSVTTELENLSPLSDSCSIYRVPERLRQLNERAYTPQVVSIGPLHHGRQELKAMEEHKKRYLQKFLRRIEVSVKDFITLIRNNEARLRNCYEDPIEFDSDDFVRLIFVDAAFMIELFLVCAPDRVRMRNDIESDLYVLENQIPVFILKELFELANEKLVLANNPVKRSSLFDFIYNFFKYQRKTFEIKDLLKSCYPKVEHLLHYLEFCHLPLNNRPKGKPIKTLNIPSINELYQAGVKFKLASSNNRFDIKFSNGVLEIPKVEIDDSTEVLFRNLLAFEHCHYHNRYIADYVIVLKSFLNAPKDVELLVQQGIIENGLEDGEAVSILFQDLCKRITVSCRNFHFTTLAEDLNAYYNTSWHKWKANLKQNYFNNPWVAISVIAASSLLILTFIQAICSIIQVS